MLKKKKLNKIMKCYQIKAIKLYNNNLVILLRQQI